MRRQENEEDIDLSKSKQNQDISSSNQECPQIADSTIAIPKNSKKTYLTNDEKLIILLKKTNRSFNELLQIEHLTQDLKFFEQINKDATNQKGHLHRKICKYLKYDYRQKGRIVFYQGDIADSFFIVLQGKCLVLINDNHQTQQQQQQQQQQFSTPNVSSSQSSISNQFLSLFNESKKSIQSPLGANNKKSFSLFQKVQNSNNAWSTQRILRWRFLHKIVWTIIHVNRFIRLARKRELLLTERNPNFVSKMFRMIGQKSFMNERFQRIRKEVQQTVHPDIDIQFLENAPHFFERQNNQNFIYQAVKLYQKGESFGELGLLSRKPRSATVICLSDCIFASLSKQHYSKTLKEVEQHQINKRIGFLFQTFLPQQLKVANEMVTQNDEDDEEEFNQSQINETQKPKQQLLQYSESKLNKIQLYFTKKKVNAGKVLQKQGDPIEKLYIIKKGEVNCFLTIPNQKNPSQVQKINLSVLGRYEIIGDEIILQDQNSKKKQKEMKQEENPEQDNQQIQLEQQTNQITKEYENKICYYSAVVKSFNGSVLEITKSDFKRMLNEYPEIRKYLKVKTETKIEWMEQRKKEQLQIMKKIANNQSKTLLNEQQEQIIQENPHLLRKHQFNKFKRNSIDNSIIKKNFQFKSMVQEQMNSIQQNIPQTPTKSKSPPKQQVSNQQTLNRKNSKLNELTKMMASYFKKDIEQLDPQHHNPNKKEEKQEQMIQDGLAIKYGYNPSSLSSQKIRPQVIIDFIFNHKENQKEQQNEQILQLSGQKSISVDPSYLNSLSSEKAINSEKQKGYKIDYSTLGYSDSLINSIKRRQTMIDLMSPNGLSNMLSNKSNRQLSNSVEKPKKKMHITHDAFQLKEINKINKQILKSSQEIQRTTAFYNQSKEVFINNLASSSKSSVVSPLRYKKMFDSKISKIQQFEKLFNKTIHSPKSKAFHKQQSVDNNSNRSRQKSSIHSNISSQSLSPTNKSNYPKSPSMIQQKSPKINTMQKSPSMKAIQQSPLSKPESYCNSPSNFSACIRQTSFGQSPVQQKNSLSITIDTPPIFKKLTSINLQDTFQLNKQDSLKEDLNKKSYLSNNILNPPNASRASLSKLSKIIQPSPKITKIIPIENDQPQNKNYTNESSQLMSTIYNSTLPQQNDETQETLKQNNISQLSTRVQNYNSSRFRQASDEQKKKFANILNKLYSPITKNQTSPHQKIPVNNKEVNIHVQQKKQQSGNKSQTWAQSNKFSPFEAFKSQQEINSLKNISLCQLEENQSLLLIQSSSQIKLDEKQGELHSPSKGLIKKKSVFSMQAISNNKLESSHSLKENNISTEKIVILNHLGKPVNYYLSQNQQQPSLANLDCFQSTTINKQSQIPSPILSQNQAIFQNLMVTKKPNINDMQTSTSYDISITTQNAISKPVDTDNINQQTTINSAKAQQKSHFNFNPIFNANISQKM